MCLLNVKAGVAAFNQEKALVGAFSVITNLRVDIRFQLYLTVVEGGPILGRPSAPRPGPDLPVQYMLLVPPVGKRRHQQEQHRGHRGGDPSDQGGGGRGGGVGRLGVWIRS